MYFKRLQGHRKLWKFSIFFSVENFFWFYIFCEKRSSVQVYLKGQAPRVSVTCWFVMAADNESFYKYSCALFLCSLQCRPLAQMPHG